MDRGRKGEEVVRGVKNHLTSVSVVSCDVTWLVTSVAAGVCLAGVV